jgi:hypothetical protein
MAYFKAFEAASASYYRKMLDASRAAAGPAAADVLDHPRGPPLAGQGTAWALTLTTGKVFIIGGRVIT